MKILGLTGSIGMGKSEVARMLRELGLPVYDADAAVHRLYAKGGAAVEPLRALFPDAIVDDAVDRAVLSRHVMADPAAIKRIEGAVYPLLRAGEAAFLDAARAAGAKLAVLDVPMLFENGREKRCDAVMVVSAPVAVQRARVLARPGMTADKLDAILSKQMPDEDKRARADFVVPTDCSLAETESHVRRIVESFGA